MRIGIIKHFPFTFFSIPPNNNIKTHHCENQSNFSSPLSDGLAEDLALQGFDFEKFPQIDGKEELGNGFLKGRCYKGLSGWEH